MAPECLIGEAYNLKADVYSFAIVVWEMLSGETAYSFVRDIDHLVYYVIDKSGCPEIDERWPDRIKVMLKNSFDTDINMRPVSESRICLGQCCSLFRSYCSLLFLLLRLFRRKCNPVATLSKTC